MMTTAAAGEDIVSAHREIRSRLTYEVGVIVAQKQRKADQMRQSLQRQLTRKQEQVEEQEDEEEEEEDEQEEEEQEEPKIPPIATQSPLSFAPSPSLPPFIPHRTPPALHLHPFTEVDLNTNTIDDAAIQRAASAAEVLAADAAAVTGRKHWGKMWVAAEQAAEKGEESVVGFLIRVLGFVSVICVNETLNNTCREGVCHANGAVFCCSATFNVIINTRIRDNSSGSSGSSGGNNSKSQHKQHM